MAASKTSVYTFFVVGGNKAVIKMFLDEGHKVVTEIDKPHDIVVFTGGPDVFPLLYGQKAHPKTFFSVSRDLEDNKVFHSLPSMKPKIGICRGAQFLCVKSGGSLWQDVDGHLKNHEIEVDDYNITLTNASSTHHQMMIPPSSAHVIAYAAETTQRSTDSTTVEPDWEKDPDPEIVFMWDTNCLCFQPHPEYHNDKLRELFFDMIYDYFDRDVYPEKYKKGNSLPNKEKVDPATQGISQC